MNKFPGGVWPVMITPFNAQNEIDYNAVKELVSWYLKEGVHGLFSVCQSSEMFYLSLSERVKLSECVIKATKGKIPVISSGHVAESLVEQAKEIEAMAKSGASAIILITNRLAREEESDNVWRENCERLLDMISPHIKLGLYECPFPYKRLMSKENMEWCVNTGRFYFLKDTSCDARILKERIEITKGSCLKIYNANTSTLLESLRDGAFGYSGVMANFHPSLYVWLWEHYQEEKAVELAEHLTMMSFIEKQCYPVNAKYYLKEYEKVSMIKKSRVKSDLELTDTYRQEIAMLQRISARLMEQMQIVKG